MACYFCGSSQSFLVKTPDWSVKHCKKCHIAATSPPPDTPDYQSLDFHQSTAHDDQFNLTRKSDLPPDWQELIDIQVGLIKKHVSIPSTVLEIGCGEGILLDEIRKEGFGVSGIEPSLTAIKRAEIRELKIHPGMFPEASPPGEYDVVILSQVFEHIENPNHFLKEMLNVCRNGYLLFTQTNYRGLIPRVQNSRWYAWVPEQHFWHFTLKGLTNLLETYGVSLIDSQYSSLVHPHNYSYRMARLIPTWQDQFTAIYKVIR